MKIGDIVKLIAEPNVDWMFNYLEATFQVLDFPTETGVLVKMVGADPAWFWHVGRNEFKIVERYKRNLFEYFQISNLF